MVPEGADRPVAIAKGLVQPLARDLPQVSRRGGQDDADLSDQFLRTQALLQANVQVQEPDDIGQRLRKNELAAARDDRHAARPELAQFLHPGGIAVHVDRLIVHAVVGEEFLGPEATRASGLPEHPDSLGCVFGCEHGRISYSSALGYPEYMNFAPSP